MALQADGQVTSQRLGNYRYGPLLSTRTRDTTILRQLYRSPAAAIATPPEWLAYVAAFDPAGTQRDAMTVVDCDAGSSTYGEVVGSMELPTPGNECTTSGGTPARAHSATRVMPTTARS